MKKLVYIIFGIIAVGFVSCVDDYEDANPPRLLNGPASTSATVASEVVVSGGTVEITVVVSDAPAGIDSASVLATDALGVDKGGFTMLVSGQGATNGNIVMSYATPVGFSGNLDLAVRVWDGQVDDKGDNAAKGSDPLDVTISVLCGDLAGSYNVTGTIGFDDFGSGPYNYVDNVTLEDCEVEDVYAISDITGGLYSNAYAENYETDPAAAILLIDGANAVTWEEVSDQFGEFIIQNPAAPMSSYDPATKTFTINWLATRWGENGETVMVLP